MEKEFMQSLKRLREKHPDAVVLLRRGDFYTMFGKDAHIAHSVLGLDVAPLTIIGGVSFEASGFRFCELDNYLPKLVRAGFRVVICDFPQLTNKIEEENIVCGAFLAGFEPSKDTLTTKEILCEATEYLMNLTRL